MKHLVVEQTSDRKTTNLRHNVATRRVALI